MAEEDKVEARKKSWIGKIGTSFSKFITWLAKGQEGNPPCAG